MFVHCDYSFRKSHSFKIRSILAVPPTVLMYFCSRLFQSHSHHFYTYCLYIQTYKLWKVDNFQLINIFQNPNFTGQSQTEKWCMEQWTGNTSFFLRTLQVSSIHYIPSIQGSRSLLNQILYYCRTSFPSIWVWPHLQVPIRFQTTWIHNKTKCVVQSQNNAMMMNPLITVLLYNTDVLGICLQLLYTFSHHFHALPQSKSKSVYILWYVSKSQ